MTKFKKYRGIDNRYWAVPIKYCSETQSGKKISY